ncbi:hypothetical protein BO94DRAFT_481807 [Aspergillus sclerotioniger CBS 115572]|uniref:Heterokaryon incompatibility domain-containing protein n=1 Tax=Aspergillus sclerotioniger CBS 115572 TaxID=1450535 RepID=A0A317XH35_9EURO|nr:hypothetical protein BO94DRAFT_481807 [Aspergillus sclerotioniger CBS 115572]PWY96758.1 hypothetical protein BO94DRAFT_481807 [Aspergillus sclerotioniger CBS 115572]
MNRWHESGCRRPDVSAASGIICCNYCFAVPTFEESPTLPTSSPLESYSYDLAWPSVVSQKGQIPEGSSKQGQTEHQNGSPSSDLRGLGFPKITSKDGIRLIRLKAGTFDSPLHAELEVVRINHSPVPLYEALSYTSVNETGDRDEFRPVFVGTYWDVVYVPYTCEQALRSIRDEAVDRLLWVDSLCINPADLQEKSQQVSLISHIYQRATSVIAYLGDETADSAEAMGFLKSTAMAGPGVTVGQMHIDKDLQSALKSLLNRPYFFRIWAVQEVLLAREFEVVCGRQFAPWPKMPFTQASPDLSIPNWLFRDQKWYGLTDRDLSGILIQALPYKCLDPRDKIFAVLGLIAESGLVPDYTVPIERVYTGLTEYLVKYCDAMDVLRLAGRKKLFDLPSWVPDWSQACTPDILTQSEDLLDEEDNVLPGLMHVLFTGLLDHECDVHKSTNTSVLRTRAIRLCNIQGTVQRFKRYAHVSSLLEQRTNLIITVPDPEYQPEEDGLFILGGCGSPIILRNNPVSGGYTLVTACTLSLGAPPTRSLLVPWPNSNDIHHTVSPLSLEENNLIQEFHLILQQAIQEASADHTPPVFSTIRDRVLSFSMISLSPLVLHEAKLRETWNTLSRELGWMFRDQEAIWQLLQEVNRLDATDRQGESIMRRYGNLLIKYCGRDFPSTYTWDLRQFCWSFLHRINPEHTPPSPHWSPILNQILAHLPDILKWAQTTEQLLRMFEYTDSVFRGCWTSFPGSQLAGRWTTHYNNFCDAVRMGSPQNGLDQRPSLDESCHWDVQEFETHLRMRERLWGLTLPPELNGKVANSFMMHAWFRSLGLELYDEEMVEIW